MNLYKCKTNFQSILSKDYYSINECLAIFNENIEEQDILHGKCIKINNKKDKFYTKTYDINSTICLINTYPELIQDFYNIFDTNIYYGCCNCVNVTLYMLNVKKITAENCMDLGKYIYYVKQSILNMKTYLSDWIYRLHIDPSVFKYLEHIKTLDFPDIVRTYHTYVTLLQEISNYDNCELYLSDCISYSNNLNIGLKRVSRFSALYDKSVSICAVREADGIIDMIDCHNLKLMEKNPMIGLIYYLPSAFAQIYYDKYYDKTVSSLLFTVSAGMFALKCKIKQEYYECCVKKVLNILEMEEDPQYHCFDEWLLFEIFNKYCIGHDLKENINIFFPNVLEQGIKLELYIDDMNKLKYNDIIFKEHVEIFDYIKKLNMITIDYSNKNIIETLQNYCFCIVYTKIKNIIDEKSFINLQAGFEILNFNIGGNSGIDFENMEIVLILDDLMEYLRNEYVELTCPYSKFHPASLPISHEEYYKKYIKYKTKYIVNN